MTDYEAYPEYKDSRVEWAGSIPSEWTILKAGSTFRASKGKTAALLTKEYCGRNMGEYPVYSGQTANGGIMGMLNSYEIDAGAKGVILVSSVGEKAMTNRLIEGKFSLSQNCMIIRPILETLLTAYYNYQFQILFKFERSRIPQDMQPSFRTGDFYGYKVLLPPLDTQRAIVEFLDRETAHIDAGIANMESLVALLTEKRSALISEVVTRGIPGEHTEYKDSGVEWLGEIPVGWEVQPMKKAIKSVNGGAWGEEANVLEETIRCIRVADFDRSTSSIHSNNPTNRSYFSGEIRKKSAHSGDLILEKSGGGEKTPVGNVVLYSGDTPVMYSNFVTKISLRNDQSPKFWAYLHSALYYGGINLRSIKQNTGIQNLDTSSYLAEKVTMPPLGEQQKIVEFLDRETTQIDLAIANAKSVIGLLKEKRQALISDVVTGKIDVRNAVN